MALVPTLRPHTTPFNEGYRAAAAFTRSRGQTRQLESIPYPAGSLAALVWAEGWTEWVRDLETGMTPPSWRV